MMARDKNPSLEKTCVLCRSKVISQLTVPSAKKSLLKSWKVNCLEALSMLFDLPVRHPFVTFVGELNRGKICNRCLEDTGKIHSMIWQLTKLEGKLVDMQNLVWTRLKSNYEQLSVQTVFGGSHKAEALLEGQVNYEDVVKIIFEDIKYQKDSWPEFNHRKRWRKACDASKLINPTFSDVKLEECDVVPSDISDSSNYSEEDEPPPSPTRCSNALPARRKGPTPRLLCTADPDSCSKTFPSKKLLQAHITRCHPSSPPAKPEATPSTGPEVCDICGVSVPSNQLKRHFYYRHQGVGKFKCEVCSMDFSSSADHSLHVSLHTSSSYPFQCVVCQNLFTNSMDLRSHVTSNHLSSGLKCPICGLMKPNDFLLQRHIRIHDRVKRFTCAACGKQFSTNAYLKYHEEHWHTNAERKFPCEVCGKEFKHQKNVQRHLVSHREEKPHKCKICEKTFNYSHLLKKHEEIHSGTKNYECHLCGKRFKQEQNLKQHMKSHRPKASKKMKPVPVEETTYRIDGKDIPVILQVKGMEGSAAGNLLESNIIEATLIPSTGGGSGGDQQAEYETVQEIELGSVGQELVGDGGQTATVVFLYEYNT